MKKSPKQVVLGTETGYKEGGGAEEERKRNYGPTAQTATKRN